MTITSWLLLATAFLIIVFVLSLVIHASRSIDKRGKGIADDIISKQAEGLQERGFKYGDKRDVIG